MAGHTPVEHPGHVYFMCLKISNNIIYGLGVGF